MPRYFRDATETLVLENKCKRQHFRNIQAGWDRSGRGLCSPPSREDPDDFSSFQDRVCRMWNRRSSAALLVGSSVVRWPLAHHSHGAVFGHDTLTLPEHGPLSWEGTWHQALHEWSSDVSRQIRANLPWTTGELWSLHGSWSRPPERPPGSAVVLHQIKWPKHSPIQKVVFSVVRR